MTERDTAKATRLDAAAELERLRASAPIVAEPTEAVGRAVERVRAGVGSGDWRYELLAACTRVDPESLYGDPDELWLRLASGVVRPVADPPHPPSDNEAYADWHALTVADWVGAVERIIGHGAGIAADAESLASYAAESRLAREIRGHGISADALAPRFRPAAVLLRALGAIDDEATLTGVGAWGVPEALRRALAPTG